MLTGPVHWHSGSCGNLQVWPRSIWGGIGQEELLSARILWESNMPGAQVRLKHKAVDVLEVWEEASLIKLFLFWGKCEWNETSIWCLWQVRLHRSHRPAQHIRAAAEASQAGRAGDGGQVWAGVHTEGRNVDQSQQKKLELVFISAAGRRAEEWPFKKAIY